MQFRYVFSELGQGLRRNLSMHIAVVLTLFVSMTLLGLGVLMKQQTDIATLEASPVSLMPEALLTGMSDADLRDFFAFLMKP